MAKLICWTSELPNFLREGEARETELTQIGGRALTPDYAAPEQIAGAPMTTAVDIYALGVMLYELMVGVRPYRLKRESRGELEQAILAGGAGAPEPSGTERGGKSSAATTAKKLSSALKGDLDTIVCKSLKKMPAGALRNGQRLR